MISRKEERVPKIYDDTQILLMCLFKMPRDLDATLEVSWALCSSGGKKQKQNKNKNPLDNVGNITNVGSTLGQEDLALTISDRGV